MAEPTPVRGLFETHVTVRRLGPAVAFYRDVVGLPVALELPDQRLTFFWVGGRGRSMLGLWEAGSAPLGMQLHLAFAAALDDVLAAPARLRSAGVTPLSFSEEPTAEPSVLAWMPAAAVYFRDPDGNLLEYIAMLEEEPRPSVGVVGWSAWTASG